MYSNLLLTASSSPSKIFRLDCEVAQPDLSPKELQKQMEGLNNENKKIYSEEMMANFPRDQNIINQLSKEDREHLRKLIFQIHCQKLAKKFPKQGDKYFCLPIDLLYATYGRDEPSYDKYYNTSTKCFKFFVIYNINKDGYNVSNDEKVIYSDIKDLIKDLEAFLGKTQNQVIEQNSESSYKKYIIGGVITIVVIITVVIGVYFYNKGKSIGVEKNIEKNKN